MNTTTPAEIHATIVAALGDRAKLLRHEAASRKYTGPAYAGLRERVRAAAKRCDDLQRILGTVSSEALADLMTRTEA